MKNLDIIFEKITNFKQKFEQKEYIQLDDTVLNLMTKAIKLTMLWVCIISVAILGIVFVVCGHAIFGSIFFVIAGTLFWVTLPNLTKKWELIGTFGIVLIVGNIIGIMGSLVVENFITGWHLVFSILIIIFGVSLLYVADRLEILERKKNGKY